MRIALRRLGRSGRVNPVHLLIGRSPKGMPLAEWESIRRPMWPIWLATATIWGVGAVGLLMVANWEGFISTGPLPSPRMMVIASVAALVGCLYLSAIPIIRERRFHNAIRLVRYEVCLRCGYDLSGLSDVHRCPECGLAYEKGQVRAAWEAWLGPDARDVCE